MQKLAAEGQLKSFYHGGFWQCMDTQREMNKLEGLCSQVRRPGRFGRGGTWGFAGVRMVPGVLPDETRSRSVYTQRY